MTLRTGDSSGAAISELLMQGIIPASKPNYDAPALPRDLTQVGDEELMVLYSELTAYADFVSVQVSCAQVDERYIEKKLSSAENIKMLQVKSAGIDSKSESRVTFARAQVAIDPMIVDYKQELEQSYAYRKLIEAIASNLERDSSLVSRELTRRTATTGRRSNRWSA